MQGRYKPLNVTKPMKTCITYSFVILLTSSISFGQHMTYIGAEGAITSDKYEIIDPCQSITSTAIITASWGISIGQQIHRNLVLESGVIWKYYDEGFEYTRETSFGSLGSITTGFQSIQIPLRLIARINLNNNKLFLNTVVGYHLGINRDYGYDTNGPLPIPIPSFGRGYNVFGTDTIKTPTTENSISLRKTFGLIEAGLGLEYLINTSFIVSISESYFAGLDMVNQETMSTGITNGTTTCTSDSAVGFSKGSYSNLRLSFKYVISNLWRKENNGL